MWWRGSREGPGLTWVSVVAEDARQWQYSYDMSLNVLSNFLCLLLLVFEVRGGHLVPWVILEDGPGSVDKGFKAEWMTVKDHHLYIGGLGKEWTSQEGVCVHACGGGERAWKCFPLSAQVYVNDHPQYVKVVDSAGVVQHQPWARNYNRMKESAGIVSGGCVCW